MGVFTRQYPEKVDSIVTECYVYAPSDLASGEHVRRVKIQRSLWDTGASVSLISARVARMLYAMATWRLQTKAIRQLSLSEFLLKQK